MARGRSSRRRSSSSYRGKAPSRSRTYNLRGGTTVRKAHTPKKYKSVLKPAMKMVRRAVSLDPRAIESAWKTGDAIGQNIRTYYSKRGKRGYNGGSQLGGKFSQPWRKIKKQKIMGKWTAHGIKAQGITLRYEARKSVVGEESVAIGHTSLPGQVCTINFWRAIIKYLMVRTGIQIKDYGNLMVNEGFVAGDRIIFYFYGPEPEDMTANSHTVTVTASSTYDSIAAEFNAHFDGFDLIGERPNSIEFNPAATSKMSGTNLQLNTCKVSVSCSSKLTLQNVTTEDAEDDEADDINAVPLVGKIYHTAGNNILQKSNRKTLPGLFQLAMDDVLFEGYSKQLGSNLAGTGVQYYPASGGPANNDQTVFFKLAEPPRDFDVAELYGTAPVALQPGEIKTSELYNTFEMSLTKYWELLYTHRSHKQNANGPFYNKNLGTCKTLVLEKAVGRKPLAEGANNIKLWIQLQYSQSVLVHGRNSTYTIPVQFQVDYD